MKSPHENEEMEEACEICQEIEDSLLGACEVCATDGVCRSAMTMVADTPICYEHDTDMDPETRVLVAP